jgi:hypothetical protein
MTIQTSATQPTLTASEVARLLVQPLEQASTFLSAGPQIIDSAGPVRVPRIASGASAGFYAAGAQISESNASFDEVQLLPSSLKGIKSLTKVSNELVRQATHTVGALDTVLSTRLVTDVSNVLDAALYDGTGASDTIKGIFRQTGITTAQGNHVAPTHWVMTPASFAAIRKVKVGSDDNRYVIEPNTIQNGVSFQLLGLPVIITDYIPAVTAKNRVALVDFSKVVVARDQNPTVAVLDQTFGDYDTIGIRVTARFDVALLSPKAVTLLTEA